jgi:hypothetical protein
VGTVLRSFLIAVSALYLFGTVLTGFASLIAHPNRSLTVNLMVQETITNGITWPFTVYRIFHRVLT